MGKLVSQTIKGAPAGKYGDGDGLQLTISAPGRGKWTYRFMIAGKAREMGLGDYPAVTLTDAREKAQKARLLAKSGLDPIEEARRDTIVIPTFGAFAVTVIEAQTAGVSAKHAAQWRSTLATYASTLNDKRVDEITTEDVLAVLQPIWLLKPETAGRVRNRIERILNAAKAKKLRAGENPAAWRGHLDHLLPKQRRSDRHHAALDYKLVPAFIARLREIEATRARCLEFIILTACRLREATEATWSEIDLEAKLWRIGAARMKAGREHQVPLTNRVVEIVEAMALARRSDFVFPGEAPKRPMSPRTIEMTLRWMGEATATPHGFRSSFRDWCGDVADAPREIAESALAHNVGSAVERAYRRGNALERRRKLMDAWANYCAATRAPTSSTST